MSSSSPGRRLLIAVARAVTRITSPVEGWVLGNEGPRRPPVFILGLPRSGSTLLFQTLSHSFDLAYPTRLGSYLWPFAGLANRFARRSLVAYSPDFQSHYGTSKGLSSPLTPSNWNLWFDRDSFVTSDSTSALAAKDAPRLVGRVERTVNGSYVDKNQRFNQWVPALAELFPKSVFLVAVREPEAVAFSILRARRELAGGFDRWVFERPRSQLGQAASTPEVQVAAQVWGILEDLRQDMMAVGPDRFAVVDYERFCASPAGVIENLSTYFSGHGIELEERAELPGGFSSRGPNLAGLSQTQIEAVNGAVEHAFRERSPLPLPCRAL